MTYLPMLHWGREREGGRGKERQREREGEKEGGRRREIGPLMHTAQTNDSPILKWTHWSCCTGGREGRRGRGRGRERKKEGEGER